MCSIADLRGTLADDVFGGVLCSDAFRYFEDQETAVGEVCRIVGLEGTTILARVGNVLVEPNEGIERDPGGYATLFAHTTTATFNEGDLLETYLRREIANPVSAHATGCPRVLQIVVHSCERPVLRSPRR